MATASSSVAIWITQTCGQKVVSRRNSVSTVTKSWAAKRAQISRRLSVVAIKVIRFGYIRLVADWRGRMAIFMF